MRHATRGRAARQSWRPHGGATLRAIVLVGCGLFASRAQAQSPPEARAQRPSDSTVALALYQKAAARFAAARTIRAGFEQTLISPVTRSPRLSRGEMLQRPPARFAFRFTDPAGDVVLADGEALWVYLPSTAKGQVLKLPRELGGAFDVVAKLLANPGDRNQVRIVAEADMVGGESVRLYALTPRSAGAPFQSAKVWIGADALVRQIEIEEPGGLRRRLRFTNMRLGARLPKNAFVFTVPDGVRIIDQAALMGGARKP